MNRYAPRTPRMLFGLAAVTLTTATLAITVLAPAAIEYDATQADVLTHTARESCVPARDGVVTAIDVVAVRGTHVAPVAQSHGSARDGLPG